MLSQDPKDRAPLNRSSSESLSPNMQNVTSAAKPFSDKVSVLSPIIDFTYGSFSIHLLLLQSGKDLNNRTSEESPRHPVYGSSPTSALSSYSCPDNFSRSHSDSYQPPRTGTQRGQYDWSITLKENSNFLQEDSLPTSGKSVGSAGRNLPPQHKSTSKKGDSAAETIGIDYSDFERRTGKSMVDSHDDSSNGDESRFYHVRTPSKDALLTASRPSSIAMRTEETTAETVDTLTQQTSEIRQSWDLNTLEGLRAKLMAVQKESVQVQKSQCELISNLQKQLAALHNHYEEMMAQSNSEAWRVIDQQKETIAHLEEKIACFQVQEKVHLF